MGGSTRYRRIRELGKGAMATVHLAEDSLLGRPVALKVIHPHLLENQAARTRFRNEARAAASLSHPHIVAIHDFEERPEPFLVMEFVQGQTLEAVMQRFHPFTQAAVGQMARHVLGALAAAHTKGVIHRDIKPSNILIDDEGSCRLADFGLAHLMHQDGLTAPDQFIGTVRYASPEQVRKGVLDGRGDVFSLGAVIYHLLLGRLPFEGESIHQMLRGICEYEPPPPTRLNRKLLPFWDEFLGRLLQKDVSQRPDAREAMELLSQSDAAGLWGEENRPLRRLQENAAETRRWEENWLHAYFKRLASKLEISGKAVQAHKMRFRADLYAGDDSEPKVREDSSNTDSGAIPNAAQGNRVGRFRVGLLVLGIVLPAGLFWLSWHTGRENYRESGFAIKEKPARGLSESITKPTEAGSIAEGKSTARWEPNLSETAYPDTMPAQVSTTKDLTMSSAAHADNGPRPRRLSAKPSQAPSFLQLKTRPPFAEVWLADSLIGNTPLRTPLQLPEGVHRLSVRKPGFSELIHEVALVAGDTASLALSLQRLNQD